MSNYGNVPPCSIACFNYRNTSFLCQTRTSAQLEHNVIWNEYRKAKLRPTMECCWVGKVVNQTLLSTLSTFFSGEVRRTSQKKKNREKNYCCWCAARNSGSEAVKKSGVLTFRASHSQSFALLAGIFFFFNDLFLTRANASPRSRDCSECTLHK